MASDTPKMGDFQAILDLAAAAHRDAPNKDNPHLDRAWAQVRGRADELFALAQLLERVGDQAGLRKVAERLGGMETKRPRVALALGRVFRMLGQNQDAQPHLQRAAKRGPKIVDTHIALATLYLETDRAQEAMARADTGLALHPENVALRLIKLRAQAAQDPELVDFDGLDALLREAPGRAAAHRFRLSILRRLRRIEPARAAVDAFAAACPRQCDGLLEHAALDMLEGQPRAAQRRLEVALAEEPPSLERLDRLGQAYGATHHSDGVLAVLNRLVSLPATVQRLAVQGRLLWLAKDHAGAVAIYEQIIEAEPERHGAWGHMIDRMTQLGRGGEAYERYCAAPKAVRLNPEVALKAATAAWESGSVDEALIVLQQPEFASNTAVLRQLTERLTSAGQIGAAREKLMSWRPRSQAEQATRLIGLGIAARAEGDFLEVERVMEAALALDPTRVSAHWHLAHTRFVLCDPDGAMAAWKAMIALNRAAGVQTMKHQGTLLWHKAEEQQLDPDTTKALAAAFREGPIALREEALRVLRTGVDLIAPSLSLMIALRQLGRFLTFEAGTSPIPEKIHQYWEGPLPPDLASAMDRMRDLNPESVYQRFDRASARSYLETHAAPDVLRAFDLARHAAERADIFRLLLLLREGGIYIDADDFCRGPVRQFLPQDSETVLFQEYHGALANNFIATIPGNPMLEWALSSAVEETLAGSATSIWLRTGPGLITRAAARLFASKTGDPLPNWHVFCQTDMIKGLVICAPFSYKLDHRHWMKLDQTA